MRPFVLQMAGIPGSGKSAIAAGVGQRTKAVVLDKDVMMAAAVRAGVAVEDTGGLAYEMGFAMARSLLKAGQSVVLDSPAAFEVIREKGRSVAEEAGAHYYIVECVVPEVALAEARLENRTPTHALHPKGLDGIDTGFERDGTSALSEPHLELDTSQDLDTCLERVLEYLRA